MPLKFNLTKPCSQCPFLKRMAHGFTLRRLYELIGNGEFHCHMTGDCDDEREDATNDFVPNENSSHCAGALIFLEKRGQPNQMMRLNERLGFYDKSKLDMKAPVR